ncbi:hypothetical protein GCM10010170_058470 [Dactylosporangium salmoneum]|uniref:Uncharacterized protein n=1 Tax=Dactylosporangium salmoneum TaxID=53361 RepID=A0ABN3GW18_9ACTN
MGASSWSARTDYQEDLEAALRLARQDAYKRGSFYRAEQDAEARTMTEEEYVVQQMAAVRDNLPDEFRNEGWEPDDSFVREAWHAAQIEVTDPDTLLASQPFSGTHSVIDMTGVGAVPADGIVAPVPDGVLDNIFGTRRPSVAAVGAAIGRHAIDDFGRDRGAYLIAYDGAVPAFIYFLGHSGD